MQDKIKNEIQEALREFLRRDQRPLLRVNAHEISLSHRIAVYMERRFHGYNIDCEYNKHFDGSPKRIGDKKIRPDIIVHRRHNSDALVIIEVKKAGHTSKAARLDINKLKYAQKELGYALGAYIGVLKSRIDLVWIENGEEGECRKLMDPTGEWR